MISRVEVISILLKYNLHFAEDDEGGEDDDLYVEGLVRLQPEGQGFRVRPLRLFCREENPPAWEAVRVYLGEVFMEAGPIHQLATSISLLNDLRS